jgi:hypothetical protein
MPVSPDKAINSSNSKETSGEIIQPQERPDVLRKQNQEDLAADLKNLYRKIGETGIKIDDIKARMEDLKSPSGANKYASRETTLDLLNKLQEELNFHTTKHANFQRLIDDLESKLEQSN